MECVGVVPVVLIVADLHLLERRGADLGGPLEPVEFNGRTAVLSANSTS